MKQIIKFRAGIKPLSVNESWQGRRFKTDKYKDYEKEFLYTLPEMKVPGGKLGLKLKFGFSSKNCDIDNPTKPILDIMQKKWNFNDKMIYRLEIEKEDVGKGEEFVEFELLGLKNLTDY